VDTRATAARREILEMTGRVARIGIHDDVAAGLASFSSKGG
jgi:hypothetical protein